MIYVDGAEVFVLGGWATHLSTGSTFAEVASGRLALRDMWFEIPAAARTVPFIKQSGAGVLIVKGCDCSAAGANNNVIQVGQDNLENDISGNNFENWGVSLPATFQNGCYGPNKTLRKTFTPVVKFTTPGTFAPTYTVQQGQYWIDAAGFHYEIRILFATNAYTGASGSLYIDGLPISAVKNLDTGASTVGAWSKFTLGAGYSQLGATISVSLNGLLLRRCGTGASHTTVGTTECPASTSGFELCLSGVILTK